VYVLRRGSGGGNETGGRRALLSGLAREEGEGKIESGESG